MNDSKPSIGVAVITHKAKHHIPHCLPPLLHSPLKPRVVVVILHLTMEQWSWRKKWALRLL